MGTTVPQGYDNEARFLGTPLRLTWCPTNLGPMSPTTVVFGPMLAGSGRPEPAAKPEVAVVEQADRDHRHQGARQADPRFDDELIGGDHAPPVDPIGERALVGPRRCSQDVDPSTKPHPSTTSPRASARGGRRAGRRRRGASSRTRSVLAPRRLRPAIAGRGGGSCGPAGRAPSSPHPSPRPSATPPHGTSPASTRRRSRSHRACHHPGTSGAATHDGMPTAQRASHVRERLGPWRQATSSSSARRAGWGPPANLRRPGRGPPGVRELRGRIGAVLVGHRALVRRVGHRRQRAPRHSGALPARAHAVALRPGGARRGLRPGRGHEGAVRGRRPPGRRRRCVP